MSNIYEIIKRPIVTEKSNLRSSGDNQVTFEVALTATKDQIRNAVQYIWKVKVASVNTSLQQGKRKRFGRNNGRRQAWKKAIVSLAPGSKIEFVKQDVGAAQAADQG